MAYKDRKSRKLFVETWKGRGYEKGETQQFWLSLLTNVLGYQHNDTVLFEHHTTTGGFIDVWIRQSDVMIEQKSIEVDLDKPEIRQGEMKTPLQQVQDYAASLPVTEQPKYLVTCNFDTFRVYDRTKYGDKELADNAFSFSLSDLVDHPEYLGFIIDPANNRLRKEQEVSEQAGRLIGDLYDMLRAQYHDPDSDEAKHSLNVLCVRLVFCLFCEDAGLFGEPDAFVNYIRDVQPQNIRIQLQHLFENLDTPRDQRDEYDIPIKVFPYVNGGLFREKVVIPNFTQEIKDFLLDKVALPVNWSNISPTIFGGIFESTLNPETRRKGGMHYTSPENIHKVIDPLFLDDLKAEFDAIRTNEELSVIQKRNRYRKFHEKLCSLIFFDPACGSGNFLTETYICLRRLEYAVLKEYKSKQMSMFDSAIEGEIGLRIKLDQFYGIEINDFAVAVAETALWISRLKANNEYLLLLDLDENNFPLNDRANIICENALRFDWNDLVEPSRVSYIMGNPPFVGQNVRPKSQTEDMRIVFGNAESFEKLDYVASWFKKAAGFINETNKACFVATNSIAQGEQASLLWGNLKDEKLKIDYAYQTFVWSSEATEKAAVHCVIIGFSKENSPTFNRFIQNGDTRKPANNINGYLVDAPNIFIKNRSKGINADKGTLVQGSPESGGGNLILTKEEKELLCEKYPELSDYIHPYIGAREFLNETEFSRYCFWFVDKPITPEIANIPEVRIRLEAVRASRVIDKTDRIRKTADTPYLFAQNRQPKNDYLVIPIVTSENRRYVPIGFVNKNVISSNAIQVMGDAGIYEFGLMISSVHMAWMRQIAGRLKSDYRYSPFVFYTFPFPDLIKDSKTVIERTAQEILNVRALHADMCLADMYNESEMPEDLKAAHEANDRAVMDAYGFSYDMTEPEIVAELMKMYQELTEKVNK